MVNDTSIHDVTPDRAAHVAILRQRANELILKAESMLDHADRLLEDAAQLMPDMEPDEIDD